ncbi:hypothetical protein HDZ31DRAFT_59702 [Schizophyllum fasciatum]
MTDDFERLEKAVQATGNQSHPQDAFGHQQRRRATIPDPPPSHTGTDHYWHYGWLMTAQDCKAFLERHNPMQLEASSLPFNWLIAVRSIASFESGWSHVSSVFVPRTADMPEECQSAWEPYEVVEGHMTFVMIVSTARRDLRQRRPWQDQMNRLIYLFGREPEWMPCAMSKKEFDFEFPD